MSLRYEQYGSLLKAKEFLYKLANMRAKDLKIIKIRDEIWRALKHYPPLKSNGEPMFSKDLFTENDFLHKYILLEEILEKVLFGGNTNILRIKERDSVWRLLALDTYKNKYFIYEIDKTTLKKKLIEETEGEKDELFDLL